MIKLTREQRVALKRVYDRGPIRHPNCPNDKPMTYREFRRTVGLCFDGSGCIMVPWAGMFLGIEKDGYTHS